MTRGEFDLALGPARQNCTITRRIGVDAGLELRGEQVDLWPYQDIAMVANNLLHFKTSNRQACPGGIEALVALVGSFTSAKQHNLSAIRPQHTAVAGGLV